MNDYAIVGGGISGLTAGFYLAEKGNKVIIIDPDLGGNHRVTRVDGFFSEHGPRIYLNNYVNFKQFLKDLNLDFYELFEFEKYLFDINDYTKFSIFESASFAKAYILYTLGIKSENTMKEFSKDFSEQSIKNIRRICLKTDGADIDRYTLDQFLSILDQNIFYKIYKPKKPNDIELFPKIKKRLEMEGIKFIDEKVISYDKENGLNGKIKAKNYIFAIPPTMLLNVKGLNLTDEYISWAKYTKYHNYIPITFHFSKKIEIENNDTKWGIIWKRVDDYTISTAISLLSTHDLSKNEMINEVLKQLNITEKPIKAIVSPHVKRINGKWIDQDTSFVLTKKGYSPIEQLEENIFFLGPQNGHSNYSFVSAESAVENAMALVAPEKIRSFITITSIMKIILVVLLLLYLLK